MCLHEKFTREVSEVFLALLGYILAARSLTYSSLELEKLSSLARKSEKELELSSSMSLLAISERILSVTRHKIIVFMSTRVVELARF